jgi:N-acetylglutamate synthase-like GNAT family acetyltransferase
MARHSVAESSERSSRNYLSCCQPGVRVQNWSSTRVGAAKITSEVSAGFIEVWDRKRVEVMSPAETFDSRRLFGGLPVRLLPHPGRLRGQGAREVSRVASRNRLTIRRYRSRDSRAVRALLSAAHIGGDNRLDATNLVVATNHDSVVGCAALQAFDRVAVLHSVAVEKRARRKGIGKRLVRACLASARRRNVRMVVLMTMFWNVNFFRRFGFRTVSRRALPDSLQRHPLIIDPVFRYCTPMVRRIRRHPHRINC